MTAPEDLIPAEILLLLEDRRNPYSRNFYKPLDPQRRRIIRDYYSGLLPEWAQSPGTCLSNSSCTRIASGFQRVVIGDYGAFIEFSREQALLTSFTRGSGGNKYNWLRTKDSSQTKIYEQLGTVKYADYQVGKFYVDPKDVRPAGGHAT